MTTRSDPETKQTSEQAELPRRAWLLTIARNIAGAGVMTVLATVRANAEEASAAGRLVVYKDPNCGCCRAWVTHLRDSGLKPEVSDRRDMDALKDSLSVPPALRSCHTAIVGRFVVEGHVPASDIKRLLSKNPKQVAGLAVPGMPGGSPGMEMPGRPAERYDVIAYSADGTTHVFAKH